MAQFSKIAVLDTNILVTDPKAILKFPDTLVIIPRVVIEELDGLKNSSDASKRTMVRKASWLLDEITEEHSDKEIMPLKTENSFLIIEGNYHNEFKCLEPEKPDNQIISVAVGYAKEIKKNNEDTSITLYSNDVNVRIIARGVARQLSIPLQAGRYTVISESLDEVNNGIEEIFLTYRELDALRNQGNLTIDLDFMNGEHIMAIDEINPKNTVLSQYDAVLKKLVALPDYKKGSPIWGSGNDIVRPIDVNQSFLVHDILNTDKHINFVLSKVAGAGKNYIATACALNLLQKGSYNRLLVVKPMIDIDKQGTGYLPGSKEEKLAPWFDSFKDTMTELTNDGQSLPFDIEGKIELDVVTHMRGRSIPRTIIIIDECQNFSEESIKTLLTRAGEDTKVILMGDLTQIDNPRLDAENNGLRIWSTRARDSEVGFNNSTYILLESNFRSPLSAWASTFY